MSSAGSAPYRGYRQAGVRLREPVVADMAAHRGDRALPIIAGVHRFDKAHLVMLAETGLVSRQDAAAMMTQLRAAEAEGPEATGSAAERVMAVRRRAGGGIHSGEHLLIQRLGEGVGGQLSIGRSSADLGAVALRLLERDRLTALLGGLLGLRGVVVTEAVRQSGTVIPGRTQGQPAQPTTVGHILSAWGGALERHHDRIRQALARVDRSPAGAAMMVGAAFPIDRERTAELLGFASLVDNTYDAVQHHDHVIDCLCAMAVLGADLSRWSDDLLTWSSPEIGLVDIPDRFCGTSSILAQAKNPYMPQLVKGSAAASVGALMAAFTVDRGPTGIAVLDRHGVSAQLVELMEATIRHLGWWKDLLPALRWDAARGLSQAADHFVPATEVAALLVADHGLSWREAHQVVGVAVRRSEDAGDDTRTITPALLCAAAFEYLGRGVAVDPTRLASALDPRAAVARRTLRGGPSASQVERMCAALDDRVHRDADALAEYLRDQRAAEEQLERAVDAVLDVVPAAAGQKGCDR